MIYLIIKKIAEAAEVYSKCFPADTKEVQGVGQDNQVLVDHIQQVVFPWTTIGKNIFNSYKHLIL